MSHDGPVAEPHPLCSCPELTWDAATGRAEPPDLDACRSRVSLMGIDPHPVLTADDFREIVRQLPKPGPANLDPEKWAALSRPERRALWRHHRKVTRG